ncbi:MAG: hypothetical protein FWD46_09485 [Cystobacterineae bacterium]|nr:hypothetical protein [Cystobacterineae bacterium]
MKNNPKKHPPSAAQLALKLQKSLTQTEGLLEKFAALLTQHTLNAGWPSFENTPLWAPLVQKTLHAWLASEEAIAALERWVENLFNRWNADGRRVEEALSENAKQALLSLSMRPFSPSPALLKSLLDSPPIRELMRKALSRALSDFARRATASVAPAPVAQVAQGVGQWAKMAARSALSKAGALGDMVGAVSSEMERQAEKRAAEFVDAALEKTMEDLAQALSCPNPNPQGQPLRRSLLETALRWRLPQLARELANADVPGMAQSLQNTLAEWVDSEAFADYLNNAAGLVRNEASSWKEMLEKYGLLEAWLKAAQHQTLLHLQNLAHTPAFATWLRLWVEVALED